MLLYFQVINKILANNTYNQLEFFVELGLLYVLIHIKLPTFHLRLKKYHYTLLLEYRHFSFVFN